MEKQQIIELIKKNPQISYEEIKTQAKEAGVPLDILEEAWNETRRKKNYKKWKVIISIIIIVIIGAFFAIKNINFSALQFEEKIIPYNSGQKSIADCIDIAEKEIKNWMNDYRFINFMGGTSGRENSNSLETCTIGYVGENGKMETNIMITSKEIGIQKAPARENKTAVFEELGSISSIMKYEDFYEKINKNEDFTKDLKEIMEESNTGNPDDVLSASSIWFKDGKYNWQVTLKSDKRFIHYIFNAVSGDFISKNIRET